MWELIFGAFLGFGVACLISTTKKKKGHKYLISYEYKYEDYHGFGHSYITYVSRLNTENKIEEVKKYIEEETKKSIGRTGNINIVILNIFKLKG